MKKLNPTCSNMEQVGFNLISNMEQVAQISHYYFPGKPLLTWIRTVERHQTIRIPCLHICEHICVWSRKAFAVCFLASFCDSAWLNWALQFKSVDLCSLDCGNGSGADPWFGEMESGKHRLWNGEWNREKKQRAKQRQRHRNRTG